MRHLLATTFAVAMMFALPVASNAQEIDTAIRGNVITPDGGPAVGAAVTVTDTRTNSRRSTTTSASGAFTVRGLAQQAMQLAEWPSQPGVLVAGDVSGTIAAVDTCYS